MANFRRTTFSLNDETNSKLDELVTLTGTGASQLVREAIHKLWQEQKALYPVSPAQDNAVQEQSTAA